MYCIMEDNIFLKFSVLHCREAINTSVSLIPTGCLISWKARVIKNVLIHWLRELASTIQVPRVFLERRTYAALCRTTLFLENGHQITFNINFASERFYISNANFYSTRVRRTICLIKFQEPTRKLFSKCYNNVYNRV